MNTPKPRVLVVNLRYGHMQRFSASTLTRIARIDAEHSLDGEGPIDIGCIGPETEAALMACPVSAEALVG